MNPWIKSGVCLLIRNAVRNGMYKRSGQEADLRNIPIVDIAQEALGPYIRELRKEIMRTRLKALDIRKSANGNAVALTNANLLKSIAKRTSKLIDDYQKEVEQNVWRMF